MDGTERDVQLLTWDDCSVRGQRNSSGIRGMQGCESTHSPRGHERVVHAGLGDADPCHPGRALRWRRVGEFFKAPGNFGRVLLGPIST